MFAHRHSSGSTVVTLDQSIDIIISSLTGKLDALNKQYQCIPNKTNASLLITSTQAEESNTEDKIEEGFKVIKDILWVVNQFGITLESYQETLVRKIVSSILVLVFGDTLPLAREELKQIYGLELNSQIVLALTPRQVGKTTVIIITMLALLMFVKSISICYIGAYADLCKTTLTSMKLLYKNSASRIGELSNAFTIPKIKESNAQRFVLSFGGIDTRMVIATSGVSKKNTIYLLDKMHHCHFTTSYLSSISNAKMRKGKTFPYQCHCLTMNHLHHFLHQ